MYYGLIIRIKHNNKIRKFGVLNQYGDLLQVTYSELIKYVRKGEVVNIAPNGDYITGKNCSITQIPLFDGQMNQVGGIPYEEYRNWVINEIQRNIQLDNEKELVKQQKEECKQEKYETKQEETFRDIVNEQSDNEEDLISKYVDTLGNAVDTVKKEAKKRLNKEQYLRYLTTIENYLDKAEHIGSECIRVKNLTNHELRESGTTEYRRALDARTSDNNLNNYILSYGVIELRNKIGSLYNQAKNIINGELTSRDKEFYTQRLETIKGYIIQIQNLHRETSNILKSNEQTKIEMEQAKKEIREHEQKVSKGIHSAKVKIQQLNYKLTSIRFECNKLSDLEASLDNIDNEATNLYEQAMDEVKEAINSDIGMLMQGIEEKREVFKEMREMQKMQEMQRIEKEQAKKLKEEQKHDLIAAISKLSIQLNIITKNKNNIVRADILNIENNYTSIKLESNSIEDVGQYILNSLKELQDKLKAIYDFLEEKADTNIEKCKNIIDKYRNKINNINKLEDIDINFYKHEFEQLLLEINKSIESGYLTLENYTIKHPSGIHIYTKEVENITDSLKIKYAKLQREELDKQEKEKEEAERVERELQAIDKALNIINNEQVADTVYERDNKEKSLKDTIICIETQANIKIYSNKKVKSALSNYIDNCNKAIETKKELERNKEEHVELLNKQAKKEQEEQLELEMRQTEKVEANKLIDKIQSIEVVDTTEKLKHTIQELKAENSKDDRIQQAIRDYKDKCQIAIDKFKQQDMLHETAITNNLSAIIYESRIKQAQSSEDIENIRKEIQTLVDRKCKAYESYSFHNLQYDKKAAKAICNFVNKVERALNNVLKLKIEHKDLDSVTKRNDIQIDISDRVLLANVSEPFDF